MKAQLDSPLDDSVVAAASPPPALILCAAAAGGISVMTVELAAVRLLAPWFGTSQTVWTNVIGVVLLALAIGYLLGARWAVGPNPARRFGALLLISGAIVAALPLAARVLGAALVPRGLTLEEAAGLVTLGSLGAALALFLLPATLLGAAGPLALESLARRRGGHAGTAGGHVLAASTLASLVGAFGTSHFGLPHLGVSGTFLCAAALLATAGSALLVATRSGRPRNAPDPASARRDIGLGALILLCWVAVVAAATHSAAPQPRLAEGRRLLAFVESKYQLVMAVEEGEGDTRVRFLQVNEGVDSFQSVWRPAPGLLGEGYYYDHFALPAFFDPEPDSARGGVPIGASDVRPWRTLVLGLGAGTVWRILDGVMPPERRATGAGAEIDAAVVDVGRRWFDLPGEDDPRWRVHAGLDARLALRVERGPFDLIAIDAYTNQHQLPPHLVTVEFFREVRAALAPGGYAALNVGAFDLTDPLLPAIAETVAVAFEADVLATLVPNSRNAAVFARNGGPLPQPGAPLAQGAPAELVSRWAKAALPGAARIFSPPATAPMTDDRTPLEPLERASLAHGRARRAASGDGPFPENP